MRADKIYFNQKKESQKKPMQRLYIMLLFICIFIYSVSGIEMESRKNEIALYLKGTKIELKNEIIEHKSKYFISKEDVEERFDKNIQYEASKKSIITTNPTHVASFIIDEKKYNLNGQDIEIQNAPFEKKGTIYLPLENLKDVYEFEVKENKNNRKIAIFMKKDKLEIVKLKKEENLKTLPSIFAGSTKKISKEERLVLLSKNNKYINVLTEDLKNGYIPEVSVETIIVEREEKKEDKKENIHVIKNYENPTLNFDNVKKDETKKNVVLVSNFEITSDGNIEKKYNADDKGFKIYINKIEKENMYPYALITIKKGEEVSAEELLNRFETRSKLIEEIKKALLEYNMEGIAIQYKEIKDKAAYTRFIKELKPRIAEIGKKVILENKLTYTDLVKETVDNIYE